MWDSRVLNPSAYARCWRGYERIGFSFNLRATLQKKASLRNIALVLSYGKARALSRAFQEATRFSAPNLKDMRSFAEAWPEEEIVQVTLAQIPWYHHIALRDHRRPEGPLT